MFYSVGSGIRTLSGTKSARRVIAPASLPSLKSENSGNDPTVSIVPSGGSGWKNVEKVDQGNSTAVTTATTRTSPVVSQSQSTASSATIRSQESDQNDSTSNQTVWSGGPVVTESKVAQCT